MPSGDQDVDVRELIDRAVFDERDRIARGLHDLVIQRLFAIGLGLQALNRQECEPARSAQVRGFEPTVRLEGPLDSRVPPDIQLELIATLRATLSNVVRHAAARRVWVNVTVAANRLELLVEDDGRGIPPEQRVQHGGLAGITRRAAEMLGHCRVYPPGDGGTGVLWAVPLGVNIGERATTGAEPVEASP
ncbi:MAG TPA: ATP-binding protein [Actinophytocola sp.]|uniref:sensor histidine kinase n=1 Tax=Actinophytocola sp. TaxID=1872138 RepID=UPI002E07186A|nr:ATP-binding protein [Actinophytocola sp.]